MNEPNGFFQAEQEYLYGPLWRENREEDEDDEDTYIDEEFEP